MWVGSELLLTLTALHTDTAVELSNDATALNLDLQKVPSLILSEIQASSSLHNKHKASAHPNRKRGKK